MTNPIAQTQRINRLRDPNRVVNGPYRTPQLPVTGIVVSADDPTEQGRLRVYCQALNDDPRNPESVPWAMYCSPFFGTINDPNMRRGSSGDKTQGAVSYGLMAVPEVGAEVLVTYVNGDPNARVWMGCIPNQQQINTWGHGRYVWTQDGYADGPYSGGTPGDATLAESPEKIQPLYDNLARAFNEDKTSPEWLSRGAELQGLANPTASQYTGSRDQRTGEIQDVLRRARGPGAQLAKHYADTVTSPGYGWSGIRSGLSKTSRVSRVYGLSTPGLHSFTMDDRHGNCRIRVRTTGGSQFLLDDTNERIYLSTGRGESWYEMDWNGNIDTFAGRRYSVHAMNDINFTSHGTLRLMGARGVHIVAGMSELPTAEQNLPSVLPDGQVRIHGQDDIHIFTDRALRTFSQSDTLMHARGSMHLKTDDTLFTWSKKDTNIFAFKGSIVGTAGKNINGTATKDISLFAGQNAALTSVANTTVSALTGKLDVGAGAGLLVKGMGGSIDIQAVDGGINLQTQSNSFAMDTTGIRAATSGQVLMQGENIEYRSTPPMQPDTTLTETPPSEDCSSGGPFPYTNETSTKTYNGQTYTWPSGIDNVVRACYNAGFRGSDLVRMAAIMGQESSFGKNVRGPARTDSGKSTTNDPKWHPSCLGPFQMRVLRRPDQYTGLDAQRRLDVAFDLDASAKWAYQLQRKAGWNQWSGFTDGGYKKYLGVAQAAVDRLCGSSSSRQMVIQPGQVMAGAAPGTTVEIPQNNPIIVPGSAGTPTLSAPKLPEPVLDISSMSSTVSAIKISSDSVKLQGVTDVFMKTAVDDIGTSIQCVRSKMDDIVGTYNKSFDETLNYIRDSTDQFKNMILTMATNLQTGLAQAANEVVPTSTIASLVSIVNDINNVVNLIAEVQGSINAFAGFPQTVLGGVEELYEIPALDMNLSALIPLQISSLPEEVEQTFSDLRNLGQALPESGGGPIGGGLMSIAESLGIDTNNTPPTEPTSCP